MNTKLFKALSDPSRISILRLLFERDHFVELLAARLNRPPSNISFHLKKLEEAGLVQSSREQYYVNYRANPHLLEERLGDLIRAEGAAPVAPPAPEEAFRRRVLESFFEGEKLKSIPVARKKRQVILEHLLTRFEFDRPYREVDLNQVLAAIHDDFCTLRREFIMWRMMRRENGIYYRVR